MNMHTTNTGLDADDIHGENGTDTDDDDPADINSED